MKRNKWLLMFFFMAILIVSACSNQTPDNQGNSNEASNSESGSEDPIKVGLLLEQTGFFSWYGKENWYGAQLFVDNLNESGGIDGREIELVIYDNASNPEEAVSGVRRFTSSVEVDAIVGLGLINTMMAINPMVEDGPITYSTSGAYNPEGEYVFGGTIYAGDMQKRVVQWLKEQGYTSFALITTNDDTGQQASGSLTEIAEEEGLELTAIEYFNPTDVGVMSQLTNIRETEPDALIAWVVGEPLGVVFQGLQQVNMEVPVIGSHGNLSPGFLQSLASSQPDELYVPATKDIAYKDVDENDPQYEVINNFHTGYVEKFDEEPGLGSGTTYDVMALLAEAFREAGTDKDSVKEHLETITDFVGVAGIYNLSPEDHRGLGSEDAVLLQIVDGEINLATD